MAPAGTLKPTLQSRHQLNCSGITIDATAYDTRRHHLLTYDSHALKPHTLRLFSLRREIRSTPLFDNDNPPPPASPPSSVASALPLVKLIYAYELDVFLCVFSPLQCGYRVLILEPASLKKLVLYNGPTAHQLRCVCFDDGSGRVVLASRVQLAPATTTTTTRNNRQATKSQAIRVASAAAPVGDHSHVVHVVELTKRSFRRPTSAISVTPASASGTHDALDRVMLCVEKLSRATLWHGDDLDCIAAAHRLQSLFGSGVVVYEDDDDDDTDQSGGPQNTVVLEWRQDPADGQGAEVSESLVLVRRIVHEHDAITSLAVDMTGLWLFTGHRSGQLNVWSMARNDSSVTDADKDSAAHPRTISSTHNVSHKSAIAAIEFKTSVGMDRREQDAGGREMEMVLFTTERGSGETRHWRFCTAASDAAPLSLPQLQCLGVLDVDPAATNAQTIHKNKTTKRKRGVELFIRTLPICIGVQMGNNVENLLVVTRRDMIHVIKIHALLQVVHDVPSGEEIFTLRALPHADGSRSIVCFSGVGSFSRLRVSTLDASLSEISAPHDHLVTPPAEATPQVKHRAPRVTRLQVCLVGEQSARIVCGWSTGVVEVYAVEPNANAATRRVMLLQDPRLDVDVSAVAIVRTPSKHCAPPVNDTQQRSWGGLFKPKPASLTSRESDGLKDAIVFAGSVNGAIFGWHVAMPSTTTSSSSSSGCQFVFEAVITVIRPPAHSAHVVDLLPVCVGASSLLSMGADGMVKLWAAPTMQLVGHIHAAASVGATGTRLTMLCSCVQVVDTNTIAVGYEDGAIGVWRRQSVGSGNGSGGQDLYVELAVTGKHERRVSHLVGIEKKSAFASASLDMTIVLWSVVHASNCVEELRFFELGAPVVDCCIVGNLMLAALRDEVCWFAWDDSEKSRSQPLPVFKNDRQLLIEAPDNSSQNQGHTQREDSSPRLIASPLSLGSETKDGDESIISIPSVVVPGSLTALESLEPPPRSSLGGSHSGGVIEGWRSDPSNDSPVDAEVIGMYLQQFVASSGTAGMVAAESLGAFLAIHHLPLTKRSTRPDFAVRKFLHDHKIDPKTRLSAAQAMEMLLEMQNELRSELRGNVTEATRIDHKNKIKQNALVARMAQPRTKKERILPEKSVNTSNRVAVVTYNLVGEKTIKWVDSNTSTTSSSNQETTPPLASAVSSSDPLESGDVVVIANPKQTRAAQSPGRQRRRRHKQRLEPSMKSLMAPPPTDLPDAELLQRVHLSPSFQSSWTKGYCWCPSSQVAVSWDAHEMTTEETKCSQCRQRRHTLRLHSGAYKPHFTARMIVGIITDVYAMLKQPAETLLFENGGGNDETTTHVSVHEALWRLFQNKYGVQHVVETKLKLLFVSMCHYVREIDAIAVFGELLALFQRPESDDEQVPPKMVALCVAIHSWLYDREMVVNGEPMLIGGGSHDKKTSEDVSVGSKAKASHWQFVALHNALFCAQEVLMYPLVSPGYLRNILMYMDDYSQQEATRPSFENDDDQRQPHTASATRWIEIHRLLRLLVGEWKQQTTDFRAVERLLFTEPLVAVQDNAELQQSLASVLEKLRLILSCFVFYDHERVGAVEINDFNAILRRLKYLWPNERLTEEQAAGATHVQDSLTFENTILAASKRFGDTQGDGRIGYLDFWAMLYIMGVRTRALLRFREIPSFCKDYKLEVSPQLHDMLSVYMGRSSALLLPRGVQTAKSSVENANRHHHRQQGNERPMGGLSYDGVYVVDRSLMTRTLSVQELLDYDDPTKSQTGLYVDGAIPALRQSTSTSALETRHSKEIHALGAEPVVVGVRPMGPRPKPVAFLSVSSLTGDVDTAAGTASFQHVDPSEQDTRVVQEVPSKAGVDGSPCDSFTNVYIQFPDIAPRQTRVVVDSQSAHSRSVVGSLAAAAHDDEAALWRQQLLDEHAQDERDRQVVHEAHKRRVTLAKEQASAVAAAIAAAAAAAAKDRRHHQSNASPPREKVSPTKPETVVAKPLPLPPPAYLTGKNGQAVAAVKLTTAIPIAMPRDEPMVEKHDAKPSAHGDSFAGDEETSVTTSIEFSGWETVARSQSLVHEDHSMVAKPVVAIPLPSREPEQTELDTTVAHDGSTDVLKTAEAETNDHDRDEGVDDEDAEAERSDGEEEEEEAEEDVDEENRKEDEDVEGLQPVEVTNASAALMIEDQSPREISTDPAKDEIHPSVMTETTSGLQETDEILRQQATTSESLGLAQATTEAPPPIPMDNIEETNNPQGETPVIESPAMKTSVAVATAAAAGGAVNDGRDHLLPVEPPITQQPTPTSSVSPTPQPAALGGSIALAAAPKPIVPPTPLPQPGPVAHTAKPGSSESRHRYKFSQQPKFKTSAAVISNPYRSRQWKPLDNSDSDGDADDGDHGEGADDANDDGVAVENMRLRLSRDSIASLNKQFHRKSSTTRSVALTALAFSSGGQRMGLSSSLESPSCRGDGTRRVTTNTNGSPVRLDESAERALYGGRELNYLGEGIVFSDDAEQQMQRKWLEFFGNAEATMFSPIKQVLEQREDAQRREEEMQSRLMKKRLEQQHQDTMRLRRNTSETNATAIVGGTGAGSATIDKKQEATFRVRRLTREACMQLQQELKYGETASSEMPCAGDVQYFHFAYSRDCESALACPILTLKLHVSRGEAEMFLSTQTKTPCSSDFMWRSVEKLGATAAVAAGGGVGGSTTTTSPTGINGSVNEGHKIVLFPNDLARVVNSGSSTTMTTTTTTMFYVAVVALAPNSLFTLGVMTSGQKTEASRAIQTVDNLISHFNQLAKTYEGQASRRMDLLSSSSASLSSTRVSTTGGRKPSSVDRLRAFLASATSGTDPVEEEELVAAVDGDDQRSRRRRSSVVASRRQSHANSAVGDHSGESVESLAQQDGEDGGGGELEEEEEAEEGEQGDDEQDDDLQLTIERSSFQQLLEVIGGKHGHGLQASRSFVLGGGSAEQLEFLEDEELRLKQTQAKLSPVRGRAVASTTQSGGDDEVNDGAALDAIAVATERRLSVADSTHARLLQRVGARVKQRLSPLKANSIATTAAATSKSTASLRAARYEPKLVAYSLSSLPPPKHHHHQ